MIWFGDENSKVIGLDFKGTIFARYGDMIVGRCENEKDPKQAASWTLTERTGRPPADLGHCQQALATLFSGNVLATRVLLGGVSFTKPS